MIDRTKDEQYREMLNSRDMYDNVDDDRFEGGKPIPQEMLDKYL